MLLRKAHVQPQRTAGSSEITAAVVVQRALQRHGDQVKEVASLQPHQLTVSEHPHGGISATVADQSLLTEGVAGSDQREPVTRCAGPGSTGNLGPPLDKYVVEIARVVLLDDEIALCDFNGFEKTEYPLNIGHRQLREQLRLQHARHPVIGAGGLDVVDFDRAVIRTADGRRKTVQLGAINLEDGDIALCPPRHLARLQLRQGVAGILAAALYPLDGIAAGLQLQSAFEEVEGVVIAITFVEHELAALVPEHGRISEQLGLGARRQVAERFQHLDLIFEVRFLSRHRLPNSGRAGAVFAPGPVGVVSQSEMVRSARNIDPMGIRIMTTRTQL